MSTGENNKFNNKEKQNFLQMIKSIINDFFNANQKGSKKGKKKNNLYLKLAILLIAGIAIVLLGDIIGNNTDPSDHPEAEEAISINNNSSPEEVLASQLEDILEDIAGVRNVSVLLTMDTSSGYLYAADTTENISTSSETDSQGGARNVENKEITNTLVLLDNPQGGQTTVLLQEYFPQVRGVVVVAEGVGSPHAEAWIVSALQALLDIQAHKISVLPRGN